MKRPALISSALELERAFDESHRTPVLFFKHSLTCPVSTAAWEAYSSFVASQSGDEEVLYTLIEIQNARDLSTEVANRTGVRHESPQAVLVQDGEPIWHASHWDISEESLTGAVQQTKS